MRDLAVSPPTALIRRPADRTTSPPPGWDTGNKFLNGPFAPWRGESSEFDLEVLSGQLPDDLAGALFRISSNPRFRPLDLDRYHWWEGDGAVAAVYIRQGRAKFAMKWVETDSMKFEVQQGEAVYSGFVNGSSHPRPVPAGGPPAKNVANTNVGIFDDHLLVYFEGGLPTSMHPQSLETLGPYDFHGGIDILCTAHYKIDPASGDMLFFAAVGPALTWYRADVKTGRVVDSHTIDLGCPAMVHDYTVSENYAIFLISPTQFRLDEIMRGRAGVLWDEAAVPDGSRFVVLDRRTKKVTWYDTGLMVAPTHFFNAFETPRGIVVDVHIISRLGNPADDPDNPASSHTWFPPAMAWRFELNPRTQKAANQMLSGVAGEFPKINDGWLGRENRWGYFATTRDLSPVTMTDGLARHDHLTGQTIVLEGPDGLTNPSEPVFVPRRGAADENDGYLLSLWWNPATGLSELLVHHAGAWEATPLARVKLPVRVPFGFHGSWADSGVLDQSIAASSPRNDTRAS